MGMFEGGLGGEVRRSEYSDDTELAPEKSSFLLLSLKSLLSLLGALAFLSKPETSSVASSPLSLREEGGATRGGFPANPQLSVDITTREGTWNNVSTL
jgi:hypothetical protein